MTSKTDTLGLRIIRSFDAPRDLVWKAWTERERLMKWFCPRGFTVLFAEGEVAEGRTWRSGMRAPDGQEHIAGGVYREVRPTGRLVFTHAWEGPDSPETLITVSFEEQGGKTQMTFEQVGFATTESRDGHRGGWSEAFDNLDERLAEQLGRLTVTRVSPCEVKLVRVFDAPRRLVWEAVTKPEHVRRWWGLRDHEMVVCEMDLRVGGSWRFVQRTPDGQEHPFTGVYQEIVEGEKTVSTFIYDVEGIRDHASLETVTLEEREGKTILTNLVRHDSPESLEGHLASGMEWGAAESMNRLEELLKTLA